MARLMPQAVAGGAVALLLFFGTLAAISRASDLLYVQSLKVNITDAPSFSAPVVGSAKRGDALIVVKKSNRWFKVATEGEEVVGWVSALTVGPAPPLKRSSVFTGTEVKVGASARRRASHTATAAASRGLTYEDRRRLGHKGNVDYDSLFQMESLAISDRELRQFMQNGGLR